MSLLVMYSKHIVVDVYASTKPSCQSKYTCFLLLLFDTAKPFSEVNIMTEVRYSPPNKPLPSPPPSPPFCKTDLEPVYDVIAWWKRTDLLNIFLFFFCSSWNCMCICNDYCTWKFRIIIKLKLINCNHNFWRCMETCLFVLFFVFQFMWFLNCMHILMYQLLYGRCTWTEAYEQSYTTYNRNYRHWRKYADI